MEYLTTEQTSEYTSLSVQTLAKLRVYGGGPLYLKLGSKVVYRRGDIDDWLATKVRRSTSQDIDRG